MWKERNSQELPIRFDLPIIKGGSHKHINTHRGNPRSSVRGKGAEAFFRDLNTLPRYNRLRAKII